MSQLSTKEIFIKDLFPYAVKAGDLLYKEHNIKVDPAFIVTHWAHETGYGSNKGFTQRNLAGLYAYETSPYGINGKTYDSIDSFVVDYVNVISNDRYKGIGSATNVTEFASALKAGGYASDSNYAYSANWTEGYNIANKYSNTEWLDEPLEDGTIGYYTVKDDNGKDVKIAITGDRFLTEENFTDYLKGDYITFDESGLNIKNDGSGKTTSLVGVPENYNLAKAIMSDLKFPFAIVLLFILLLFFLYAIFIKDTKIEATGERVVEAVVTKGVSEITK